MLKDAVVVLGHLGYFVGVVVQDLLLLIAEVRLAAMEVGLQGALLTATQIATHHALSANNGRY